jgi:hypothetical protein
MYFFYTETICFLDMLHGQYILQMAFMYVSSGRMLFSYTYNSPFQCTYYPLLQLFHIPRPVSIPHLSLSPPPSHSKFPVLFNHKNLFPI